MNLIDFILNIVGLLLWLNWRAIGLVSIARPGQSLVATLKPASPPRSRWISLGMLLLLLVVRGLFYRQIGPALPWVAHLPLWVTSLSFRSDDLARMFLYSALSFGVTLGVFYLCLLLLSCINLNAPENDPYQRFVQLQLGILENFPVVLKALLPLIGAILLWYAVAPALVKLQIAPRISNWRLLGQGGLIGLAFYLRLQVLFSRRPGPPHHQQLYLFWRPPVLEFSKPHRQESAATSALAPAGGGENRFCPRPCHRPADRGPASGHLRVGKMRPRAAPPVSKACFLTQSMLSS